ncbi:MAG: ABC transporter ATP-binding protein [Bacteriovoracaceae bacterium]
MLRIEKLKLLNGQIISLDIKAGDVILIKGQNGTGKSLLLKSLARLIPSSEDSLELLGQSIEEHRSKVLYLPPVVVFDPEMEVKDFFDDPLKLKIYQGHKYNSEFMLPIESLMTQKMTLLSSGQKQLVAMFRAMNLKAQILLLDEPFAHIDQAKRKEMIELLVKWKSSDKAIVIVTHDEITFPDQETKSLTLEPLFDK